MNPTNGEKRQYSGVRLNDGCRNSKVRVGRMPGAEEGSGYIFIKSSGANTGTISEAAANSGANVTGNDGGSPDCPALRSCPQSC